LTFGMRERADFTAANVASRLSGAGFVTEFDLSSPIGRRRIALGLAGEHNVMNALAAAAAAHAAGAGIDAIVDGLTTTRAVTGRLEVRPAHAGSRMIDDSYNANPASLRAGLRALASVPGRHWLVLGEMRELGPDSAQLHAEMGDFARQCGVARLLAVGEDAHHAVEAFGAGATWFASLDDLIAALRAELGPDVTVLVKGSRSNRLERVPAALATDSAAGVGH
jgi:UDP-N-acetylmuramoyl-tripeptide--D-alanyl-D-alanine ligase